MSQMNKILKPMAYQTHSVTTSAPSISEKSYQKHRYKHRASEDVLNEENIWAELLKFTVREKLLIGVSLLCFMGLAFANLYTIVQHNQLEEATRYMTSQNIMMEKKADEMINELAKYQNYDMIHSIAEQEGMTINKNNVKDLRDENR